MPLVLSPLLKKMESRLLSASCQKHWGDITSLLGTESSGQSRPDMTAVRPMSTDCQAKRNTEATAMNSSPRDPWGARLGLCAHWENGSDCSDSLFFPC